jgi:TM2 domain-containing membrane protein YozV
MKDFPLFDRRSCSNRLRYVVKSALVAFILWCFGLFGFCGLHRFYVGRIGTGIVWLLTFGLLGIGQLVDLFLLGSMTREANMHQLVGSLQSKNINTVAPVINVTVAASPPVGRVEHHADQPAAVTTTS